MPALAPKLAPPDPAGVVLTFLESVGRRSEAELYVRLFREVPKESFAIIAVESAVLRYAAGSLVEQLRFLRELGLFAPVAVGLFEPGTAEKAALRLVKRSLDMGAVVEDAFEPDLADRVRKELAEENLPVVSFSRAEKETTRDRFDRLGSLAGALQTRKIVVLRRRGGLGRSGRIPPGLSRGPLEAERGLSVVNIRTDLGALREPKALSSEDSELLEHLCALLARPDCATAVASIASPLNLLRELFTVKGAGTLIKRGSAIERHPNFDALDLARVKVLLESSFGRALGDGFFRRPTLGAYVEENYRGAAFLEPSDIAPYLSKFAVDSVAQGEGLGRDLWEALARDHRALFWRARMENPIASWYRDLSDGMVKVGAWIVFWRGIAPAAVPRVVEEALSKPDDFVRGDTA